MKAYILFAALILGFFAVITAIARPDIIKAKYSDLHAPIDKYFAEKNDKAWKEARETERVRWMLKLPSSADCRTPKSALREIECNNIIQLHAQAFERNWSSKVQSGWKPEGVSN